MSGSPHRRPENPGPPSGRMAGLPQPPPRQSKLAIHDRRRPRQAEKTIPSVRMTRATRLAKRAIDDRAKAMFHEMGEAWMQLAEWAEKKKRKVAEMLGSEER